MKTKLNFTEKELLNSVSPDVRKYIENMYNKDLSIIVRTISKRKNQSKLVTLLELVHEAGKVKSRLESREEVKEDVRVKFKNFKKIMVDLCSLNSKIDMDSYFKV